MSSTTSHLLYPLVTADTLECLTQPAQETTRGQPKQRLTRSCPFPKQTQAPNKHYSWKFMCQNDKKINLGSIVCQISLLVPIREIDGWSKNCIKCHSAHYLPTFMAFHAHGPISLLLIFFPPPEKLLQFTADSFQADAWNTFMTTNTHYAEQNKDVWSGTAASCLLLWPRRDDTHKLPAQQHSWATHPVTLALLFRLHQLHIRNWRCKTKTLNKHTWCSPPVAWAYCFLPSKTQLCFCFGISGSLLHLWSIRREWGTSKTEDRNFGTIFLSLFWQVCPLSSIRRGRQIPSYCLGSRQIHGS